jgi:hypothetical protein
MPIDDDSDRPDPQYPFPYEGFDWEPQGKYPPPRTGVRVSSEFILQVAKLACQQAEIWQNMKYSADYWKNYGGIDEEGYIVGFPVHAEWMIGAFFAGYVVNNQCTSEYTIESKDLIRSIIRKWALDESNMSDNAVSLMYIDEYYLKIGM